jgi:hypothetical protein
VSAVREALSWAEVFVTGSTFLLCFCSGFPVTAWFSVVILNVGTPKVFNIFWAAWFFCLWVALTGAAALSLEHCGHRRLRDKVKGPQYTLEVF